VEQLKKWRGFLSMADQIVEIELVLNDEGAVEGIKGFKSKAKKEGSDAGDEFGEGFNEGVKGQLTTAKVFLANFAANLATDAVRAFGRAFGDATREFVEFEKGIQEINSLLPQSSKLTGEASESIREFATQFGGDTPQQARAFYSIVSAGVKGTANQLQVLEQANKAAVAGLVDINTSAFALVSSVNAYRSAGLTAAEASDILFTAVKEGQTTFGELASTIGRVAPLSAAAGLSFDELAGALAFVTQSGVSTAEAVTGIRAVLTSIIKPAQQSANFAKQIGIEFDTAAIRSKGFANFLNDVIKATGGSEAQLSKLFPSVEALNTVLAISSGEFSNFQRVLDETKGSTGATDRAFKDLSNTLDFQASVAAANLKEVFLDAFEAIAPAATEVLRIFNELFNPKLADPVEVLNQKISATESLIERLNVQAQQARNDGGLLDAFFGNDEEGINEKIAQAQENLRELLELQEIRKAQGEFQALGLDGATGGEGGIEGKETTINDLQELRNAQAEYEESVKKSNQAINNSFKSSLVAGISRSAQVLGKTLVEGGNVFKAFAGVALDALGNLAISVGTTVIGAAISIDALKKSLFGSPAAAIAAGVALIAIGGAIKAFASQFSAGASSGGLPSSGAGGGGTAAFGQTTETDDVVTDPQGAGTSVNVTIQGDVLDSDESGSRIVNLINEAFEKEGVQVNRGF
jgi:TP901 family phage tail tape measure protein